MRGLGDTTYYDNTYTVQSGDSLSSIATYLWGDYSKWPLLYQANMDQISNPNVITPGMELNVPDITNGVSVPAQAAAASSAASAPAKTTAPATTTTSTSNSKIIYYAGGGILLAAIVAMVMKHKKKKKA